MSWPGLNLLVNLMLSKSNMVITLRRCQNPARSMKCGDDGHQGDGSDNWPGGRGVGSWTERGGDGNNRSKKTSRK